MATSASAQISDSCTSPPLAKMPTTVQSLSRKAMREPTSRPANWRAALRPTMTSRTPRSNGRPSTIRTSSRMANAAGWTPRNGTLLGSVSPLRGRSTITTSSADASGRPAASRATPGSVASRTAWSRGTPLDSSASEPARSMMTRSGRPVLASVWRKPSDIASTDTSTPTTPAMPTTTTSEVPEALGQGAQVDQRDRRDLVERAHRGQRCPARASTIRSRLARSAGGSPMARASASAIAAPAARCSASTKSGGKRPPVAPLSSGQHAGGRRHAEPAAQDEQEQRLRQHERGDLAVGEAERLQDGQLRDALADRLGHGVAGQDQDGEEHRDQDARDEGADVADLLGEADRELLLGLGLGLVGRVREAAGRSSAEIARAWLGVGDAHDVPAGLALAELARLVEVARR